MIKYFVVFAIFLNLLYSKDEIRFGVFAYLGEEQTYERYKPLEDYLNSVLKQKVILEVLTDSQMEEKIAKKEIDIATTNPSHFLLIRKKFALSGAIATMISQNECGILSSELGGVILSKANSKIKNIQDLKGATIATPSMVNMGGFRAQAYDIYKKGIDIYKEAGKIVEIKSSHKDVIKALLDGKADVAFVRDGILELMLAEQSLRMDEIHIINKKPSSHHPYIISTELYPEWPVFAMPYVDNDIVKSFLSALYSLESDSHFAIASGIGGYTLPADYLKVEELARTLKIPPFDQTHEIGYSDIWEKYKFDIMVTFFALLIIVVYYIKDYRRKDFLNSLLINIGDGVYGVDKKGICIWINKSALDMIGYTKKEVLSKNQHFLFHHHRLSGEEYQECDCPIHKTIKDGQKREGIEYFIKKDGTFFPVALSVTQREKSGGAIVVFRDITAQKEQEEELKRKNEKLNLTLKSSHIGTWEWDLSKDLVLFDQNIFDILEYDEGFVLNKKLLLEIIHTDDKIKLESIFNNELLFDDEFKLDLRIKRVDDSYAWIEIRGKVIQKTNGEPSKLIGILNDISYIKEYEEILEDEVKHKTKELETINKNLETMIAQEVDKNRQKDVLLQQQSRLAALSEMIGNIAHQWRQPLSAITASISGLKLKSDFGILEPCDIDEINDQVMQNARFLSSTIDNFRDFFKQETEKKSFILSDTILDSIKIIQAAYDSNFIKIEKQLDKTLHYYGSENMISQVLLNILSNAKDALGNKCEKCDKKVFIALYKDNNLIKIKIKDNAGGVKDDIKEKIFDPYFTTKHQSQGTGLGLYMSMQIIQNHFGGTIDLQNISDSYGMGACFEISFPMVEDENTKKVIHE